MIQIAFQRNKCIGCYACVEAAPEQWVMSERDGKSYLRKGRRRGDFYIRNLPIVEYEASLRAAQNCPARIIKVKVL
ncbi:MAG: ferredoxin [Phaeodactylibacter sp.]|nr:ferredoxin [Phaeodactylibacter sp.]